MKFFQKQVLRLGGQNNCHSGRSGTDSKLPRFKERIFYPERVSQKYRGKSAVCVGSPTGIPFRAEREESAVFADARRENRELTQTVRKSQTGRKKKDKL